jgi:glycosyltransferase involved in cell wall biosynthesis
VATQTGGTPEVIADGRNGFLFMPEDAEDLAKKIAQLMADPQLRHRIGAAARQTILEGFTMTRMMNEIESYLQEVASLSETKETRRLETIQNAT